MEFYEQAGPMAIGSRLRRLSDLVTEDAGRIYEFYGVPLEPKWFPVFYLLGYSEKLSITEIAKRIGHSHPSVSQIVKEMNRAGLTVASKSDRDARVNLVQLSKKGRRIWPQLKKQSQDVGAAVAGLLEGTMHNLWEAMDEFEYLLSTKDLFSRVVEEYKKRESQSVEIFDYGPEFIKDFQRLNREWIEGEFELEEKDRLQLEFPEEHILKNDGFIKLARLNGEIVGTCALVKNEQERHELVKMTVTAKAKGKGIGWLLGMAVLEEARKKGVKKIFLESNTNLIPAVNLYHKLGFKKVKGPPSKYRRCNIQMELEFD